MENDPDLLEFNTWRATQPDAEGSGLVLTANDHASKSCSIWWAGPETDFLRRLQAEAGARGITLIVNRARYPRQELQRAVDLILQGSEVLKREGFDLQGVGGPTPEFFGLTVIGVPAGNEDAEQLTPELIARVQEALAELLLDAAVQPSDVKVDCGRTHLF